MDKLFRFVAVVLAITTALVTTPVSAAELAGSSSNPVLGALSGAGSVQVRGVALQKEATLFSGDRVRTGPGAYVKLSLANGARIEAGGNTEFVVKRDGEKGIRLSLSAGSIAFTASKDPLTVAINGQEVHAESGARAQVALLAATDMADVRVISGKVELKNIATKGTVAIANGAERIINLKTGAIDMAVPQIVSVAPSAPPAGIPAAAFAPPIPISTLGLLGAAGGGFAAIMWATKRNSPTTPAGANDALRNIGLSDLAALLVAMNNAVAAANAVAVAGNQIADASPAAATQAYAIRNAAISTKIEIVALNTQLNSLNSQLGAATSSTEIASVLQQIAPLRNTINAKIAIVNSQVVQMNTLAHSAWIAIPPIGQVEAAQTFASPSN